MSTPIPPPSHQRPPAETVTLTIDDREVTVPKGTLIIRAAEQLGIVIPRFCDHPLLDPAGACRQCIVEIEGQPKPATSCTTPCADEMVVRTQLTSHVAEAAQEAQLEFLLINHPLDCPMCDKGGECPLQDQALQNGPGESRFIDEKRRYEKPVAVSPNVLLDRERCVLCARCTRFAKQISGDPFIELMERGALQQVAIYEDEPYLSYFSGNIIQICPVGALTSASYRFRARPFDLRSAPSVCNLCSAGCTLNVHSRRGAVMRQLARTNMAVNEAWNCDKGRFAFKYLDHELRLTRPALRRREGTGGPAEGDGDLVGVSWSEALDTAAAALRDAGPGRTAVLTGGRLPDEDAYVLSRYARSVLGTDDVDFRTRAAGPDEDDALATVASRAGATYGDIEAAPLVLLVGLDPEEEVPILYLRLRKAWLRGGTKLVPIGPRAGSIAEIAWRWLPSPIGGEAEVLGSLATPGDEDAGAVAGALREAGNAAVVLVGERAAASPRALAAAGRLAGSVGAKLAWVPRRNNARGALDAGLVAGLLPGGRRLDDKSERADVERLWGQLPERRGRTLHGILEAAANGEIDVLHLVGIDLVRDCDRPGLARAALERVPTIIIQDLLETETARYADVVLPAAAAQERSGTFTNWEGRRQRFRLAVEAPRLAQEDWDIFGQIAGRLGHDLGYSSLDDIRREMAGLPAVAGREWPQAASVGGPFPGATDSARFGGPEGGIRAAGARNGFALLSYPLLLDRGVMSAGAHELLATAKAPFAALHPDDAGRLGIEDGQGVLVTSESGRLEVTAVLDAHQQPGVIFVPSNSTDAPAATLTPGNGEPVRVSVEPAGGGEA